MTDPYIIGDSSPFLKRVLIPFWVIRIIIMLFEIAIYGLAIGVFAHYKDDFEDNYSSGTYSAAIAVSVVIMVLIILCLVLDIVCIVKRSRRTLSPRFFLISNSIQTGLWVIYFILSVVGQNNSLGIIIAIIIFLSFLGLLIYASVIFHRFRKGKLNAGNYVQTNNPAEIYNLDQQNTGYAPTGYPTPAATYPGGGQYAPAYEAPAYGAPYGGGARNNAPAAYGQQPQPQQQGYEEGYSKPAYYDSPAPPHANAHELGSRGV